MPRNFFNGDFLNPLDFPNWQPLGMMDAEDMFEMGNVETQDPIEMLPMTPYQSAIQDPAQEAFQFPFQFPSEDVSGGEGGQYSPVDVPENILQESGMQSSWVDATSKETGSAMTEQQGVMGDLELVELIGNVERSDEAQVANESASMVGENFEGGQMSTPLPSDEELTRLAQQVPIPTVNYNDLRTTSDFEPWTNYNEGGQLGEMTPTDEMIRELAAENIQEPLSSMEQAQAMLNPLQVEPSEESIAQGVKEMYGTTGAEQAERDRMYDPATYAKVVNPLSDPDNPDYDAMYDPEKYGEVKPYEFNVHQSLVRNIWGILEQESATRDWGLVGEILQGVDPSKSLVANLLEQADHDRPGNDSPVTNQTETMAQTGADTAAPKIATGKLLEALGLDVMPKATLIELIIKLFI